MPELPEVEALARYLTQRCVAQQIERVDAGAIWVLKTFDPPLDALVGATVRGCSRRGKYLLLDAGDLTMVVHLARGGWLRWHDVLGDAALKRVRGSPAVRVRLESGAGFDLTEAGTEKRLAVWVVRSPEEVDGFARLGPDALDPALDATALAQLFAGRNEQVKGVLTDQAVIAGIGNAYSDEVLHAARLSPFRRASSLTFQAVTQLHHAMVEVLTEALARTEGRPPSELKDEKRTGLRVHARTGLACPVCGDTICEVSFATKSLQYCPTCQTGGKPLADRRLSRLLK